MSAITFKDLKTIEELCSFFQVSRKFLNFHLYFNNSDRFIRKPIPKKDGSEREIHMPKIEWKYLLNKIKVELDKYYEPLPNVVGFVKNKSIVTGAKEHVNKNFVVNIDLKDYFHSFNFGRVRGYFLRKPFNFNNTIATTLAKIVTYNNILPMGSPCSPVIANMITYSLDKNLINYCKKFDITYTRYADDLTFSSNHTNLNSNPLVYKDENRYKIRNVFSKIIKKEGFELNDSKTTIALREHHQQVTNLTVNNRVNVLRKYVKNIRGLLFIVNRDKEKMSEKELKKKFNYLYGKLSFLSMVVGKSAPKYLKYAQQFNDVFGEDYFDVDMSLELETYIANRIVVIETEKGEATGFIIKHDKSFYLITSTHSFVDNKDFLNIANFKYFYLKDRRRKKTIFVRAISEENINEDIIFFKIIDTELVKEARNKHFNVSERTELKLGTEITISGYDSYSEANTISHNQVTSELVGRRTVQKKVNCWRLKGRVMDYGMSGGPAINEKREVIGVNFWGGNLSASYIRPFNKDVFNKLMEAEKKISNDLFTIGPSQKKKEVL